MAVYSLAPASVSSTWSTFIPSLSHDAGLFQSTRGVQPPPGVASAHVPGYSGAPPPPGFLPTSAGISGVPPPGLFSHSSGSSTGFGLPQPGLLAWTELATGQHISSVGGSKVNPLGGPPVSSLIVWNLILRCLWEVAYVLCQL